MASAKTTANAASTSQRVSDCSGEGVAVGAHARQRAGELVEVQPTPQCLERVAVGQAQAEQAPGSRHVGNWHNRAGEEHLGEAEHRQGERGLRGIGDSRRGQQAKSQRRHRLEQERDEQRRVHVPAGGGKPIERAQHTEENGGHRGQHRQQHADLGGDVGADAQSRALFAPEDRHLPDDLEQPVGEAEEEAGKGDPKDDLGRADACRAVRLEGAGLEQHGHHRRHQHGGAEQDGEGQPVTDQHLGIAPGEQPPLPQDAGRVPVVGTCSLAGVSVVSVGWRQAANRSAHARGVSSLASRS